LPFEKDGHTDRQTDMPNLKYALKQTNRQRDREKYQTSDVPFETDKHVNHDPQICSLKKTDGQTDTLNISCAVSNRKAVIQTYLLNLRFAVLNRRQTDRFLNSDVLFKKTGRQTDILNL